MEVTVLLGDPVVTEIAALLPAMPAGVTRVIWVELTNTTEVAATVPTVAVAPVSKLVPVTVTVVPPAAEPLVGVKEVMVGFAAIPWNDISRPSTSITEKRPNDLTAAKRSLLCVYEANAGEVRVSSSCKFACMKIVIVVKKE